MSKHTVLGSLDECSPQTTANTRWMWSFDRIPRVKNITKIRADTFAILAVNGTSIPRFGSAPGKKMFGRVLREYKRVNLNKRLVIILDNFSSHHVIRVRQYAAGSNIHLTYLSPYSPDLNPIE